MTYDLVNNQRHYEICRASARNPKHEMFVTFSPPVPDVASLKDGADIKGRFGIGIDDAARIVEGAYVV